MSPFMILCISPSLRVLKLKKIASTNKQAGTDDCKVFAAAYSTSLVYGHDPSCYIYDQRVMRTHLIKCFEEHMIQPFPVIGTRRTGSARLINIGVDEPCTVIKSDCQI